MPIVKLRDTNQEVVVEMGEAGKNESEKVVKLLSPADLQQFLQRRGAIEQARLGVDMMCMGYTAWAEELRVRYGIAGPFSVDARTGQISMLTKDDV